MDILTIPNDIEAIDCHVHPAIPEANAAGGDYLAFGMKHFKKEKKVVTLEETAAMYAEKHMMCVLLGKDARTNTGLPAIPNGVLAKAMADYPKTFIGFGAVDPYMGKWSVNEVRRIADLGLRGLKFQQVTQGFFPNDPRVYPIYEAAQELGLVVLFHMGFTGIAAGAPGGLGLKLKYGQPMLIDDVAADFPELTIIAAHPGWPWSDEVLAVSQHKGNVFVDMSGWAPKYFPPNFVQYARTLLQNKMLFGTDWPMLTVERWQKEFAEYKFPDEVVHKIMLENPMKVLKLEKASS